MKGQVERGLGYGDFTIFTDLIEAQLGQYLAESRLGQIYYGITNNVKVVQRFVAQQQILLPVNTAVDWQPSCVYSEYLSLRLRVPGSEIHRITYSPLSERDSAIVEALFAPKVLGELNPEITSLYIQSINPLP